MTSTRQESLRGGECETRRRLARRARWLVLAAGLAAEAQSQPAIPTFASAVDVISLSVTVTDAADRFVPHLTASDFKVYEDGVRQELAIFTQGRMPLCLAILVDGSASMDRSLPDVKLAIRRLLQVLEAEDTAQIIQFNERVTVLEDFTSDRRQLEAAVDGLSARGLTGLYTALYVALKDPYFRRQSADMVRRAVVLMTDGEDTASLVTDNEALEVARQAGVAVFTISFRGPRPGFVRDRPGLETDAELRARYFLAAVARETGGGAYFPRALGELDGVFARIADELRVQYRLGYVSNNPAQDGKWRRLTILTTEPDVRLRHRSGYYAPKETIKTN